jgi:hypothetical protein
VLSCRLPRVTLRSLGFQFAIQPISRGKRQSELGGTPAKSEDWNRGRYLVEGRGHCGSCQTPRNALWAEKGNSAYAGGTAEGWNAPPLNASMVGADNGRSISSPNIFRPPGIGSAAQRPARWRMSQRILARRPLRMSIRSPSISPAFPTTETAAVARQAAVKGLALVQTPPIFIAGDLAARRLVTVLDEWAPTPATGFFLYYPSRRQMRPALKALVDFLRDERPGAFQEASQ